MFGRRLSLHQRPLGDVRSAQQKCVRRALLEPLILLNLEHLLTTPDFSNAAMSRMHVIAVEDIGAGSPNLTPHLCALHTNWKTYTTHEKARRLIQASHLCLAQPMSRFLPHWAILLITQQPDPHTADLPSFSELLLQLEHALAQRDLHTAGLCTEAIFLRHPLSKEPHLPAHLHIPREAMRSVWDLLERYTPPQHRAAHDAWRALFGPPSNESITTRLFLYMAVLTCVEDLQIAPLVCPDISDDDVDQWIQKARSAPWPIPDWMFDKHTARGRALKRDQTQFLTEATRLTQPSDVLGLEREQHTAQRATEAYLREERLFGRTSRTAHIRKRWRARASTASR